VLAERLGIYLLNSINPFRIEGQKTISLEIAQQLNWNLPDFVVVPGGNLGNVSAIASGFLLLKELGLADRIPRLVCAQAQQANPLYRSFLQNFESYGAITAGATLATAIQIGNPVSIHKAIKALRATKGIVDQASEAELANATAQVDRLGFFNDPQTGVALAVTMKLAKSGAIPKGSRVVVISTAHGLKFVDFKLRFHQGQLQGGNTSLQNLPIDVPSNIDAIRSVIDGRLFS